MRPHLQTKPMQMPMWAVVLLVLFLIALVVFAACVSLTTNPNALWPPPAID